MTARLINYLVMTSGTGGQYVIEDPDLSKKRIFIQNQAYDIDNLKPLSNQQFLHQGQGLTENSVQGNSYYNPYMVTNNKYYYGYLYGNTDYASYPGIFDPWISSLDYERLPGRQSFISRSGIVHIQTYYDLQTNAPRSSYWEGYDMNGPATQFTQIWGNIINVYYEDPYNVNTWYGINYQHTSSGQVANHYIGKLRITPGGPTWTTTGGDRSSGNYQNLMFFMGVNTDSSAMWLELDGNTSNISFHKQTSSNVTYNTFNWIHPGMTQWHYQYPSNIRHASDTRKVFYQGGWNNHDSTFQLNDEFKEIMFHRFVWNPITQLIDVKRCTINWPSGKYSYNYMKTVRYEPSWHNKYYNDWYYKPHQFTVGNKNYVTFMYCDKTAYGYYTYRTHYNRRELGPRWVTFVLGDLENDDQLTYHSSIGWDQARNYPRYWMPTTSAGNQMIIYKRDSVHTITFDSDLGWVKHDEEELSMRGTAIDSVGRVYIATGGHNNYQDTTTESYEQNNGYGYNRIWEYIPNAPVTVRAVPISTNYTYSGVPVTSSLAVTARNSLKDTLIATKVQLVINNTGSIAQFSNGTNTITVTTSSSGAVTVPFTIFGAGQPTISAHVVI